MSDVIKVKALTKRFGDFTAVDQVDMNIPRQSVYGFLGPNGSGKTTAIRMMCGLLEPTEGHIEVLGLKVPEQTELIRRKVGYMTQKFSMYGDLTILQNMQFMARIMNVPGREMGERINELLVRFKLSTMTKRLAGSLSGGQKRRLALAAAVIHRPQLLLLDEPTSEVDPNTRREFWDELFTMCEEGATVLVTTHLMDEAERCHHLAIINDGKKVADGTPEQLKSGLGAEVFLLDGPDITPVRTRLHGLPEVLTTTRIGLSLRVMIENGGKKNSEWLAQILAGYKVTIEAASPSIEDVFVMATKDHDGKK